MQPQRTAAAAASFLLPAALALTDTGAPAWILCLAGVFAIAGVCGLVCYVCCVVSGWCAQREEDAGIARRS